MSNRPKREFNPNDVAAQARSFVLKVAVILGGLVGVRELWHLLITPGKWEPWILEKDFKSLAGAIELPWGLRGIAVLRAPVEWLKGIWLFLAIPLAGIFLVIALYWFWNYVVVPVFHFLARILTLSKRAFGKKVKRHIIICLDGTWNYPENYEGGVIATSNVFKFWQNLQGKRRPGLEWAAGASRIKEWRSRDGKTSQVGLYYHGVGNPATYSKLGLIIGGAFGFGAENVKEEAYRDIIRLYTSTEDRITVVGFSRGAAIARLVAAYVGKQGIPHLTLSDTKIGKLLVGWARKLFKGWKWCQKREAQVDFLGVWDTVGAFGLGKNLFGIPFQKINLLKDMHVSECVKHVVHLLALDEQRDSFEPTLIETPMPRPDGSIAETKIEEVWFPGVHSNVGGGFANDGLAAISLEYMVGKFEEHYKEERPVQIIDRAFAPPVSPGDHAALSDEEIEARKRLPAAEREKLHVKSRLRPSKGAIYEMRPREIPDNGRLHRSVITRMKSTELEDGEYCPQNVVDLIERLDEKKKRFLNGLEYFGGGDAAEEIERECKVKVVPE
jgi:hypothetical protein